MQTWETVYPRPQLRRDSFLPLAEGWTLNGQPIRMPFPPQSPASGYQGDVPDTLRYEVVFSIPEDFRKAGQRLRLHFGAVDQVADVFLNGVPVKHHEGGYLPFFADISAAWAGENRLTVVAVDDLNRDFPYGKQRKKRGGMWYTPVSGIWQTVWVEALPEVPIEGLTFVPDLAGMTLTVESIAMAGEAIVSYQGAEILRTAVTPGKPQRIDIPDPVWWSPHQPALYDLQVTAGEDRVESYFALRTVTIEPDRRGVSRVCLNGTPLLMNGLLDQGYFPEGVYLPENPAAYEADVRRAQALGFTMLRKHIKVEPEIFYHACDRLGMLVVQDLVNNGGYSYLFDTVLPTIGFRWRPNWPVSRQRKERFEQHAAETLAHLHNHPCIVAYTIFNEGWGQFDGNRLYRQLRALDPSRLYDTASGWFVVRETDFDSRHIYFRNVRLRGGEKPLFLSECGGYARKIPGHQWNPSNEYGYGKTETEEQLTSAVERLYREMVIPAIPEGLCGVVYTQLTDVEDEVNGLYTYDRAVCKVDAARLQALMREAAETLQASIR